MAVFELNQVTKSYQGRKVLNVEGLSIKAGEIFGIVGPSGSGKSTLLRLLNFLEPPDSGSIRFHQDVVNWRAMPLASRRKITTVFQRPGLMDTTVRNNVEFGLRLRGFRNTKKIVDHWLDQVGMLKLADSRARTLSAGEAQRVALARAVILQPEVLLLDEPTANLDPANVGIIERVIGNLINGKTATIILVTHNIFQARRLADRTALMLGGEIVEVSPTDQFFSEPEDPRTSAFLRGEMVW